MLRGRAFVWILGLLTVAALPSWSQADSEPRSMESSAYGSSALDDSDAGSQTADSIPQVSGPSIDPLPESRSLFLAGLYLSQGLQSSPGENQANSSQISGFTRVLGSLHFLKVGRRFETAVDYRGGGVFEEGGYASTRQLQQMQALGRVFWQKASLTLADSLGDYPGGSFGSTWFGGASAYNLGSTSVTSAIPIDSGIAQFVGSSTFGVGQSALTNVALAELTDSLTPRSAVTIAGAYGINEYFGDNPSFINSHQASGLINYGHQLTPRTEIGVVYAYQNLQFPEASAGKIATQVMQFAYSRSLSRRWVLQTGVGPEFSRVTTPVFEPGLFLVTHQVNVSAYGSLAYNLPKAAITFSFNRLVTSGSGLFAGANTDFAQFSFNRRLSRSWEASLNAGYVNLSRIHQSVSLIPGNSYQYGFAGVAISRKLGRFRILASYQFNDESFDTSFCKVPQNCSLTQRNVALVGVYWHTRPIHLDHASGQPAGAGTFDSGSSNSDDSHVPLPNN